MSAAGVHVVVADLHERWPPYRILLVDEITIGSDPACSVSIDDRRLGPIQARISLAGASIKIEDVHPAAGMRVNGSPIQGKGRVKFDRTAVITVGDCIVRFSAASPSKGLTLVPRAAGVEHTFLDALRARPDDHVTRLVYADWLEEQDRLAMANIVRCAAGAAPLEAEDRESAKRMNPAWRAIVWCGPIERCGNATAGPCPGRWENLPSSDDPSFRPCGSCGREVELLNNVEAVSSRYFGGSAPFVLCPSLDREQVHASLDEQQRQRDNRMIIRGRPARVDGAPRLAEVRSGAEWCTGSQASEAAPDPATRQQAAEAWAQAAREEHASIAAFGGLSLQLLALGAPPELIAACHTAALDEIRHAQRSFEIASSFAGGPLAPARLDEAARVGGPTTPRALARDTFFDGCINETAAALEARYAAGAARGWLAPILAGIADDEEQHAELAWQIVAWCVRVEGTDVIDELARELAGLAPPPIPRAADAPALLACGVVGERGRAEARARALALATARLATLVSGA